MGETLSRNPVTVKDSSWLQQGFEADPTPLLRDLLIFKAGESYEEEAQDSNCDMITSLWD